MIFGDKQRWSVEGQSGDLVFRAETIHQLLKSLICENVEMAFAFFEILIHDQISIWQPVGKQQKVFCFPVLEKIIFFIHMLL